MSPLTQLFETAKSARERAYAPYSKFQVGAAIRTKGGKIIAGCNVENAAFPEGVCAEGGAISAMVLAGETEIAEVLVIADAEHCSPCGGCRQKIREFAGDDVLVHIADLNEVKKTYTMADLLPAGFELKKKV
ncbi:cytidine deaminase [Roseibium sp. TrichSKD4]|uniref:cytidine deaminase n=1 Tax=Roseibium sp. TrichSKD4 TaxID=744980 RepID=UPI0001E56343|nr:cytidine deaminase [Roseibium sp. TrichSKD4]EFO33130.1 cytidine deaminase [Roseibium sp. TrichSKD4]